MDSDEAIEQMELLGHDFFVFTDAASNQVNVVYRRHDGNYGLIEQESRNHHRREVWGLIIASAPIVWARSCYDVIMMLSRNNRRRRYTISRRLGHGGYGHRLSRARRATWTRGCLKVLRADLAPMPPIAPASS
jgi:hypothetical protein